MSEKMVLGQDWPDWWADMVSKNLAVTHNDDGNWRGGPDVAFVIENGAIRVYYKGETIHNPTGRPNP